MSTIALKDGYPQVKMAVADRDKTAITYSYGMLCFIRMPFELKNHL